MKCTYSTSLLAMYAQLELPESQQRAVELHIASCASCHRFVNELRDVRLALNSFRQDTVNSAALSSVRQRVWNELPTLDASAGWALRFERVLFAGKGRIVWASMAVVGVVSALACVILWHLPGSADIPASPAQVVTALRKDADAAAPLDPPKHTPSQVASSLPKPSPRHAQIVSRSEDKPDETLIELQTNDPSVVIYWLVSQTDSQKEESQ